MSDNIQTSNLAYKTVKTNEGDLILDNHKVSYHYERVEAWENGEKIAPISVDMALTRACGAMCASVSYTHLTLPTTVIV